MPWKRKNEFGTSVSRYQRHHAIIGPENSEVISGLASGH